MKQDKFDVSLSKYLGIICSVISIGGTLVYLAWTLQGLLNNTDRKVAILETTDGHFAEKIANISIQLQRQEDKIDKIYFILSEKNKRGHIYADINKKLLQAYPSKN